MIPCYDLGVSENSQINRITTGKRYRRDNGEEAATVVEGRRERVECGRSGCASLHDKEAGEGKCGEEVRRPVREYGGATLLLPVK